MKLSSAIASERGGRKHLGVRTACRALAGVILTGFAGSLGAQPPESWRIEMQDDGIRVFSREVDASPTRAIRAEAEIRSSVANAAALLLDAPSRPRWDENCAEASVQERVSATEDVIYVHTDLPWPVRDRDLVLRRTWSFAPDGSRADIQAAAAAELMPMIDGRTRVRQSDSIWTIVQTGESRIQISTEMHVEPGGPIPSWLLNALSIQGPYNALRNIRTLLETGAERPEEPGLQHAALPPH